MEPDVYVKEFYSRVNGEMRYDLTLFRHHIALTWGEASRLYHQLGNCVSSFEPKREKQG